MPYWLGFRQKPDGSAVAIGPFKDAETARDSRPKYKASDAEVSVQFFADDKAEAVKIAKWHLEGGKHPGNQLSEEDN